MNSHYQVYLLIGWQDRDQPEPKIWHFRLEKPGSGEEYGFANLKELLDFLTAVFASQHDNQQIDQ